MRRLHESINNYPYIITLPTGSWQSNNKIHRYAIPFSLWNVQRSKQTIRSLVIDLHYLASETSRHVLNNVLLHAMPPKNSLKVSEHLRTPWINGVPRLMCFYKKLVFESLIIRNPPPSHKFDNLIVITSELGSCLMCICQILIKIKTQLL